MTVEDFAHTEHAVQRRQEKAKALCRAIWPPDDPDRPTVALVRSYSRDTQKAWEKVCGLRTSHPDELWEQVVALLERMEEFERKQRQQAEELAAQLAEPPAAPPAAVEPERTGPIHVCVMPCPCPGRTQPRGGYCWRHPWKWVNPTPDPALTLDGLRAAAGMTIVGLPSETISDARAVASGKRASGKLRRASW